MIDKLGAGHYETLDEWPVVILCLDAPGQRPVVGYVVLADGTSVAHTWRKDGTCGNHKAEASEMDLRPVRRKPREVWISKRYLEVSNGFHNASEDQSWAEQPVLFREVMEDENNA